MPFEILSMSAERDGFTLRFTKAVDEESGGDVGSYVLSSYTYLYHQDYGSEEIDGKDLVISGAEVSADGMSVRLRVEVLRESYVHELIAAGVRAVDGKGLLHEDAYYTLNRIPD